MLEKLPRDKNGRFIKGIYVGFGFKKGSKINLGKKHTKEQLEEFLIN